LYGSKEPIAFLIASLCTHPILIGDSIKIVLPQGSPTSPTLTNLLCITLDRRLNGLAKKVGANYSRYADDITFSSYRNVFNTASFQKELHRIIEDDQSLRINEKKTRLQGSNYRQEVTGLKVNEKVNVQKRYVKQIRMWIYYWEKYGYLRAQQLFVSDYFKDKGHIVNGKSHLVNVLGGKLEFLKMVKGSNQSTYLGLKKRFDKLTESNAFSKGVISKILDIWEKEGIESAMKFYYSKNPKKQSVSEIEKLTSQPEIIVDDEMLRLILESLDNQGFEDITD
jgi:hypothetical protein